MLCACVRAEREKEDPALCLSSRFLSLFLLSSHCCTAISPSNFLNFDSLILLTSRSNDNRRFCLPSLLPRPPSLLRTIHRVVFLHVFDSSTQRTVSKEGKRTLFLALHIVAVWRGIKKENRQVFESSP